jgi:hypothetical protein
MAYTAEQRAANAAKKAAEAARLAAESDTTAGAIAQSNAEAPPVEPATDDAPPADDSAELGKLRQISADQATTIRDQSETIARLTGEVAQATAALHKAQNAGPSNSCGYRILVFNASAVEQYSILGKSGHYRHFQRTSLNGTWCHQAAFLSYEEAFSVWEDCYDYGKREKRTNSILIPITSEQAAMIAAAEDAKAAEQEERQAAAWQEVCAWRESQGFPAVADYAAHEADMAQRRAAEAKEPEPFE